MVSHKRKYCTNNKSKKLLTIMNTKLDLIQKSLDDLHKEHADASMSPTGLTDSSATLDSDSNASMYQSDLNSSVTESPPAGETETSPVSSTDASSTDASSTEASSTDVSSTEASGSPSPIVAPPSGSEESTPSWMNESPKDYGEAQPQTPPSESKTGGRRRIRKSKRQQRQYLRNKSRNRRM